jgi:hypothetical protein
MIKVLHHKDLMCTAGVHLMRRHDQPSTLLHSPFRMTLRAAGGLETTVSASNNRWDTLSGDVAGEGTV